MDGTTGVEGASQSALPMDSSSVSPTGPAACRSGPSVLVMECERSLRQASAPRPWDHGWGALGSRSGEGT